MPKPVKIGWFSTGRGNGSYGLLQSVLKAIDNGELNAEIAFVFCNREIGEGEGSDRFLRYAQQLGIPTKTFSSREFKKRNPNKIGADLRVAYDAELWRMLESLCHDVDFGIGAGYMLVAPLLCKKLLLLNLHPALPNGPKGTWRQVVKELAERGAPVSGVMVHIATPELDGGPPLSFCRFTINGDAEAGFSTLEMEERIREQGLFRERVLLRETIRAVAEGKIVLRKGYDDPPLDMTEQVEKKLPYEIFKG